MTTYAESEVHVGDPNCSERVLGGRYRLEERIGAGGMGEVWRATDAVFLRTVAVKIPLPSLPSDQDSGGRFRTEARLLASLRHSGIVRVYDYGTDETPEGDHREYLVMEHIDGWALADHIASAGRLGSADTLSVLAQAAAALQVAHRAGLVHRDVKPRNLMIQPDCRVVLVDFGLARSIRSAEAPAGLMFGSPYYMAPEQITAGGISPATDVYALGAVAYSCLAGRAPFTGDSLTEIVQLVVRQEPAPLPDDVPVGLAAAVLRALSKVPAARYADASEFAAALRGAR
ncbi:serine/threonine-protein kinase [Cryptosporangium aurantiacum]|uniref:non-specific serine/threonine protein kinase n=1 Tax=Cryptosporangium aurantiacum TaxID=134849 RepID=A0A1M7P8I8_9ACTN|nr:serine/threonine-protein kinase [Cryptosporangium aurantiacum]SHN13039.1 Serine/threonine protein kinase [Cryptosporangium aurantiacum]